MAEAIIGSDNFKVGSTTIVAPQIVLEVTTEHFGPVKLTRTAYDTYELTINGVTEKVVTPNKTGNA